MSSRFVSGGTTDDPIERDDEWLKAQQELEDSRRRKEEASKHESGKTLYEVLQSNKAAKQEAFEESIKLKNQFRNLDEDEIEFLDSVLESTRAKEEAVKRETTEQLDLFRRQQEEADKALLKESGEKEDGEGGKAGSPTAGESQWAINARKRKRVKEKEVLKGVKVRKGSSTSEPPVGLGGERRGSDSQEPEKGKAIVSAQNSTEKKTSSAEKELEGKAVSEALASPTPKSGTAAPTKQDPGAASKPAVLGLSGYSSDEED